MTDYSSLINSVFEQNNISELLNESSTTMFNMLIDCMLTANEKMNLTAIKEPRDIVLKHIADSALAVKYIPENAYVLDVGSGAGFPAIPIAILRPDTKIVALDSTVKKLNYIKETAHQLNLPNITTLSGRAEELAKQKEYREVFDIVIARAVAGLNILCELCVPFIRKRGIFIALKGALAQDEIELARSAIAQLGGNKFRDNEIDLKFEDVHLQRHIIISDKIKQTPENFPRMYNRISKKPL